MKVVCALVLLVLSSCSVFRDSGPVIPDWTIADQAGNSTENQHGFLLKYDAGAD